MTATMWLTLDDVKDRTTLPDREINRLVSIGEFPPPVERADGAPAWRESEIDEWIERRPRVERHCKLPSNG